MSAPRRPVGHETARQEGARLESDGLLRPTDRRPDAATPPQFVSQHLQEGGKLEEIEDKDALPCLREGLHLKAQKHSRPECPVPIGEDDGMDIVAQIISAQISSQQKTENFLHDSVAQNLIRAADTGLKLVEMIFEITGGRMRPDEWDRVVLYENRLRHLRSVGESSRRTAEGGWNR